MAYVNLLKGIGPLLEAADKLRDVPVEFHMVGPVLDSIPARFREQPQIHWHGPVSRSVTATHYRGADVFLFPTFSDGFDLTQLEAQAWRLPVVASRFCGDVVRDGVNGLLVPEVSADAITKVLRKLVGNPSRLREFSARSGVDARFRLKALAASLLNL